MLFLVLDVDGQSCVLSRRPAPPPPRSVIRCLRRSSSTFAPQKNPRHPLGPRRAPRPSCFFPISPPLLDHPPPILTPQRPLSTGFLPHLPPNPSHDSRFVVPFPLSSPNHRPHHLTHHPDPHFPLHRPTPDHTPPHARHGLDSQGSDEVGDG